MGLIDLDVSGPTAADIPAARLGDARELVALHEPVRTLGRLDVVPAHVLQQDPRLRGFGRHAGPILSTVLIHLGFAAAFAFLLTWREDAPSREVEIPVEVVAQVPESPAAGPARPQPEPSKSRTPAPPAPPMPDPQPRDAAEPTAEEPKAAEPRPAVPAPPPLVAPPPDAAPAATETQATKAANLEPDQHQVDQATHEARPAVVPNTLTTADPGAAFAVPAPSDPKADPVPTPTPAIPAKAPSEADKLAAALPMDTSAMPLSFRAVLSGNGALVNAAYKGVVFGRLGRNAEIGERARRQHLKGQVMVAFSIDDRGQLKELSVLQTSGNPALDAMGLAMIRAAAPFPPPPPDAQRAFTPALTFGE